jgi:plastocyanin
MKKKSKFLFLIIPVVLVAAGCSKQPSTTTTETSSMATPPSANTNSSEQATSDQKTPQAPEPVTVHMLASGFEPKEVTVKVGAAVTFINHDTKAHWPAGGPHGKHDVVYDAKRALKPGESISFTFDKPMELSVHDHFDDKITTKIIVVE